MAALSCFYDNMIMTKATPTIFRTRLGEKIRFLRKARRLSIEDLAFATNTHPSYLSDIERGRRNCTVDSIEKICAGLDIKPEQLFSEGDMPEYMLEGLTGKDRLFLLNEIKRLAEHMKRKHS